jgi:hypothetical protein
MILSLLLFHSVLSLSFMFVRRLDRRRSFARCRNFDISRSMTGSVVNATPLTEDAPGDTIKAVILASTPVAGILRMRGIWLELSSASPALIYSVTSTVE